MVKSVDLIYEQQIARDSKTFKRLINDSNVPRPHPRPSLFEKVELRMKEARMLFAELQVVTEKSRRGIIQGLSCNTDETNVRRIGASSGVQGDCEQVHRCAKRLKLASGERC